VVAAHVLIVVGGGVVDGCVGWCYGGQNRPSRGRVSACRSRVSREHVVVTVCGAKRAEGLVDT
jgi:hypothetical protein